MVSILIELFAEVLNIGHYKESSQPKGCDQSILLPFEEARAYRALIVGELIDIFG